MRYFACFDCEVIHFHTFSSCGYHHASLSLCLPFGSHIYSKAMMPPIIEDNTDSHTYTHFGSDVHLALICLDMWFSSLHAFLWMDTRTCGTWCVRLLTRVPHVLGVPLNKRREHDASIGSKVTNTLPIFSRTELFHLAAKTTYHSQGLKASPAAHEFCSCHSIYAKSAHAPTRL